MKRIKSLGGYIEDGRVNGNLSFSRALGDMEFKAIKQLPPHVQLIIADPDVEKIKN